MIFSQLIIEGITFIINCVMNKQKLVEVSNDTLRPKYYKRPESKDVLINWCLMTANEIFNLTNACNPWNKGASTFFQGNELKIVYIEKVDTVFNSEQTAGTIIDTDYFTVVCRKNEVIRIIYF